jgi:hypothetical protein
MRVNIAYSVDMESIPREVCALLPKGLVQQDLMLQVIRDLEDANVDNAISSIDDMRKEMFEIDQRLADCSAILQGYLKAKYAPPADVGDMKETLDDLKEQLDSVGMEIENDTAS